jgi:hypothetical protein
MRIAKVVSGSIVVLLCMVAMAFGDAVPTPQIKLVPVTSDLYAPGETVSIDTENTVGELTVVIKTSGNDITVKTEKTNNRLTFTIPAMADSPTFVLSISGGGLLAPVEKQLNIVSSKYLKDAVNWKREGMSDTAILEHIERLALEELDNEDPGVIIIPTPPTANNKKAFNGVILHGNDVNVLRAVKFDESFIQKLEGQKQYLTIGMAAILLGKSRDMVTAPIARIFLTPKSYFRPRKSLLSTKNNWLSILSGIASRIDANVGYTIIESKLSTDPNKTEKTNYVLVGGSFEINKSALFNIGYGIPVSTPNKDNGQLYFGITVDYNVLQALKIVQ